MMFCDFETTHECERRQNLNSNIGDLFRTVLEPFVTDDELTSLAYEPSLNDYRESS